MAEQDAFARKRAQRQKRIRRRRRFISLIVITIFLLAMAVLLSFTVFFPIKTVTASGCEKYTEAEIVDACVIGSRDQVLGISQKELTGRIRKTCPYVETVKIKRRLPNAIHLKISEASVWAAFCQDNIYILVNQNNRILERSSAKPNCPVIFCDSAYCKDDFIAYKEAIYKEPIQQIINLMDEYNITVNEVNANNVVELKVKVEGRYTVTLGTSADLKKKIEYLGLTIKSTEKDYGKDVTGDINMSFTSGMREGIFVPRTIDNTTEKAICCSEEQYFVLNSEDQVIREVNEKSDNLPLILCDEAICVVDRPITFENVAIKDALTEIWTAFESHEITPTEIDLNDLNDIAVRFGDGYSVIMGKTNYLKEKIDYVLDKISEGEGQTEKSYNLADWTAENDSGETNEN